MYIKKIIGNIKVNKRISLLSCVIAAIFGSISLSQAAVVPEGTKLAAKQEIVRQSLSEPASLDVHKVSSDTEFDIIHDFFDGLVYTDRQGNIEPRLAERWETNDNQTWVFHLRKGIKWSDGSPITAHDFVFSWRRLVAPDTVSPYGSYLENISIINANDVLTGKKKGEELGVKALDDMTLEVRLDKPMGDFLQALTHTVMVPLNKNVIAKYGEKWTRPGNFVGNGPFKLSEWKVNEKIIGVRNIHYWDDKNTVIDKVHYPVIASEKAALSRYLAGEVDFTKTIPLESFESVKEKMGEQVYISPKVGTYFYEFNNKKPPFDNIKVRQALSLAVDRDVIAHKVLRQGQKPAYTIVPPNAGGFKFSEPDYASWTQEQRIEKAKALLSEAGFNKNNPLKFNLLYNTHESHQKIAIAVSSMWKKNLGVEATLQNQEWKVMLDNMHQGKFEVIRRAWIADYNSPMSFLNMFMSGQVKNTALYENRDYDEAIKKASETNDVLYQQKGLDIITKDSPIIPIYYYVNSKMVKPHVGGFYVTPMGYVSTKDLYIIEH
ncbi:ABC transporter substrate-binding protein [Xenorhabdus innexi]|uniref:Periplasmic murein peptide-binding protein n=1 Tax=Xenorhabdus innexi TaxID=290109 RepID=A0A1N6N1A9_9GAMM|nr:ABC transporter substrate-binding protein [Xenorhabdus innexi]PHM36990.1 periplasmic murein peptide-binding protein precursor [Xenorhabdus innexi]SIP74903.1 Periplasmic oligopeptide-binding protein [Xenorhabdus innexi]